VNGCVFVYVYVCLGWWPLCKKNGCCQCCQIIRHQWRACGRAGVSGDAQGEFSVWACVCVSACVRECMRTLCPPVKF